MDLTGAGTVSPTFTAPTVSEQTNLVFQLTVTAAGESGTDTVAIAVRDSESNAPTADAGPNQTVDEGDAVTLDGSGSSDPNNDPLAYSWNQTSGPEVDLTGAGTVSPTFTAPTVSEQTNLVFTLNVTAGSESHTDTVAIAVRDSESNAPTADAGPNQTVDEGDAVTLDGSGSSDPNNDPLAYSWNQTSGPEVDLTGAGTVSPTFTAPTVSEQTNLVFTLNVTAGSESHTDTVAIAVRDSESNAPTADAGPNQTVDEGDAVTLRSRAVKRYRIPLVDRLVRAGVGRWGVAPAVPTAIVTVSVWLSEPRGYVQREDQVGLLGDGRRRERRRHRAGAGEIHLRAGGLVPRVNDPLEYSWNQTSGPEVDLTGAGTVSPTFTAPTVSEQTNLVFQLTVTAAGESGTDTVAIAVRDSESNAPTADAGPKPDGRRGGRGNA